MKELKDDPSTETNGNAAVFEGNVSSADTSMNISSTNQVGHRNLWDLWDIYPHEWLILMENASGH